MLKCKCYRPSLRLCLHHNHQLHCHQHQQISIIYTFMPPCFRFLDGILTQPQDPTVRPQSSRVPRPPDYSDTSKPLKTNRPPGLQDVLPEGTVDPTPPPPGVPPHLADAPSTSPTMSISHVSQVRGLPPPGVPAHPADAPPT